MVKKLIAIFLLLLTTCYLLRATSYASEDPTSTPSATPTKKISKVESLLKDKVASLVAKLDLVDKKGIIGTVDKIADTQITLTDLNGKTNFIDVDEITEFASPSAKESFGISDLTKGSKIAILGLYNKESRRTLARFIDIAILPKILRGAIVSVDEEEFTVDIIASDGNIYTGDVETTTKTSSYDPEDGISKLGFSKLEKDQRVIARGFPSKTDPKRLTLTRILVLPTVPKNPKLEDISLPSKQSSSSATKK